MPNQPQIMIQQTANKYTKQVAIPYPGLILALVAFATYLPTLNFGLTRLDDVVFIFKFRNYFSHWPNLLTSFHRGVFTATGDYYYRPLFMDLMQLNYLLCDTNLGPYHFVNIVLHAISVVLLYLLLLQLNVPSTHAFILVLFFAVHPALVQAVAWIPGRNDTLLAIFIFSFLISGIQYQRQGKLRSAFASSLSLLLALFTKETAIFAPFAFIVLAFTYNIAGIKSKKALVQGSVWAGIMVVWYLAHQAAQLRVLPANPILLVKVFIHRLPFLLSYLGKAMIPFRLSVYPALENMNLTFGYIAVLVLSLLFFFTRATNRLKALGGLVLFVLFLLPILLIPQPIGIQLFEHRLYLPFLGLLLFLSQTVVFQNTLPKLVLLPGSIILGIVLIISNLQYQRNFASPQAFWSQAVASSPSSGFAHMMLALQLPDIDAALSQFNQAKSLTPGLKHINFNIGIKLQANGQILASKPYLLAEQATSGYYECDFYLAKIALFEKNFDAAIAHFKKFAARDENNDAVAVREILQLPGWQQPEKADTLISDILKCGIYNYAKTKPR